LREAGLSWKKSRKVLTSPDPRYREKVDLLLQTLRSLTVNEDLFFIDELGPLQVKRYGGRCYEPKGKTPTHPQSQKSKGSITLYGALSAIMNQMTWFCGTTKDSLSSEPKCNTPADLIIGTIRRGRCFTPTSWRVYRCRPTMSVCERSAVFRIVTLLDGDAPGLVAGEEVISERACV
jgi:hypothetical protein